MELDLLEKRKARGEFDAEQDLDEVGRACGLSNGDKNSLKSLFGTKDSIKQLSPAQRKAVMELYDRVRCECHGIRTSHDFCETDMMDEWHAEEKIMKSSCWK